MLKTLAGRRCRLSAALSTSFLPRRKHLRVDASAGGQCRAQPHPDVLLEVSRHPLQLPRSNLRTRMSRRPGSTKPRRRASLPRHGQKVRISQIRAARRMHHPGRRGGPSMRKTRAPSRAWRRCRIGWLWTSTVSEQPSWRPGQRDASSADAFFVVCSPVLRL